MNNAFRNIIEPHLTALQRSAFRLCRNTQDAEDLLQEVCLRAWQKFSELEKAHSARAWLLRIQFNLHIDETRRRKTRRFLESHEPIDGIDSVACDGASVSDIAETTSLTDRLTDAWPCLTCEQQALLSLFAEGYKLKEICAITDLPLSALKARLHRARVRLGKEMTLNPHKSRKAAAAGETS